jgi:tRNA acetyltransferase TAN1
LVSSSRFNETNAKAELWFLLLMLGDKYPIISDLEFLGLITAFTSLSAKSVISNAKKILIKDPTFFQYILKIVPIDFNCESESEVITQFIENHYREYINENETFKILLKRRNHELIERISLITKVAKKVENPVDLDNPEKIIRIEILGNSCGIAFLKPDQVLKLKKENKET